MPIVRIAKPILVYLLCAIAAFESFIDLTDTELVGGSVTGPVTSLRKPLPTRTRSATWELSLAINKQHLPIPRHRALSRNPRVLSLLAIMASEPTVGSTRFLATLPGHTERRKMLA